MNERFGFPPIVSELFFYTYKVFLSIEAQSSSDDVSETELYRTALVAGFIQFDAVPIDSQCSDVIFRLYDWSLVKYCFRKNEFTFDDEGGG